MRERERQNERERRWEIDERNTYCRSGRRDKDRVADLRRKKSF